MTAPTIDTTASDVRERTLFEQAIWAYYTDLKAKGWSHPEEGDFTPEALFWRHPSGKYGVNQIEAAWNGWKLRKLTAESTPEVEANGQQTEAQRLADALEMRGGVSYEVQSESAALLRRQDKLLGQAQEALETCWSVGLTEANWKQVEDAMKAIEAVKDKKS